MAVRGAEQGPRVSGDATAGVRPAAGAAEFPFSKRDDLGSRTRRRAGVRNAEGQIPTGVGPLFRLS